LPKYLTTEIFFLLLIVLGSCDQGDACPAVSAPACNSNGITYGNSVCRSCGNWELYIKRMC